MNSKSVGKSYARKAGVLACVGVFAKILGAVYRLPLTNILGAEGMGIYQLVFSIYALALAMTSAFIPTLLSRKIAGLNAIGEHDLAYSYFIRTILMSIITSSFVALMMAIFCRSIANAQGVSNAWLGYVIISPAIVLVAVLGCFKGWFGGNLNLVPSTISIIIEQVIKLAVGLTFASIFRAQGAAEGAAAALFGVVVAEAVASLTLMIFYFVKRDKSRVLLRVKVREVIKESFPLTIGGMIMPVATFFDSIIIVNLLIRYGLIRNEAVAQYGIFTGAINAIVNFPVVIAISLAVAIIPLIAKNKANMDISELKTHATFTIKTVLVVSLPCAIGLAILAPQIVSLIYPVFNEAERNLATTLLVISSINAVFLSLTELYASLLQAVDNAKSSASNLGLAVMLRIVLLLILLPRMGIIGAAISSAVCYGFAMLMNMLKWLSLTGKVGNGIKTLASILVSGAIMVLTIWLPAELIKSTLISILVSVLVGAFVYVIAVLRLKVFTARELDAMPFSTITKRLG